MPTCTVVDLSHHVWDNDHGKLDFVKAKAAGIEAVIYKVTEGSTYQDPFFTKSRDLAKAAGLLWGVFHFGTAAPVQAQVDNLFNTAEPDDETLVALDFEHNDPHPANTMKGPAALQFLEIAGQRLGRPLTLYTGMSHMVPEFGHAAVAALKDTRVWWAQYSQPVRLHATWSSYWLWQYTGGAPSSLTPHAIDGFGPCDCDHFDGTSEQLRASWIEA